jgi:hypothetical protein
MPNDKILEVWDVEATVFDTDAQDLKQYLEKDGCKNAIDNDPVSVGVDLTQEENNAFFELVDASETGSMFFVRYITKPGESLDEILNFLPADLQKYVKPTFDEAKKHITGCSEYNVCWLGNAPGLEKVTSSFKHLHPRYTADKKFNVSLTAIIPIVKKNDVVEIFPLQWTDVELPDLQSYKKNHYKCFKDQLSAIDQRSGPIKNISFPEPGIIRYVKFNSTNYVHWTDNLTDNIYLVSLFEDATFK